MTHDLLITGISQLVTAEGPEAKRGRAMRDLKITNQAALAISNGSIAWTGKESDWTGVAATTVSAGNCAVVPGLVDPHTHTVWAGDRLSDFEARSLGQSYEAILAAGGGIRSTIRSTAAASRDDLVALAKPRLESLIASGATTIEVKSGYGFTPAAELAMLEAIHHLATILPARIVPTLLIHVPPREASERPAYLEQICEELIPEVTKRKLAVAVDVFLEKEAWSVDEAERIFQSARKHGLATKLHSDQFHSIGGVALGIRAGALSIDHLEAARPEDIEHLAASSTIATIVPGVSLHLGTPPAQGRRLIDAGTAVAVGTDLNPGSSPLFSSSTALALAVRLNGLTGSEALVAGTLNAACALGMTNAGRIEPGCPADFLVLNSSDWRDLVYTLGANPVHEVWISGRRIQG